MSMTPQDLAIIEKLKQYVPNLAGANMVSNMGSAAGALASDPTTVTAAPPPSQATPQPDLIERLKAVLGPPQQTPNPQIQSIQARIDAMDKPAPKPTAIQGITGALAQFGRTGWMDPAKAQQMEMTRDQQGIENKRNAQQDLYNRLKMVTDEDYRKQQSGVQQQELALRQREQQRQDEMFPIEKRTATAGATAAERKANEPDLLNVPPEHIVFQRDPKTGALTQVANTGPKESAPQVKYDAGIPVAIVAGTKSYVIGDPSMPPELKALADSAVKAHQQRTQEAADVADTLNARQQARAEAASARSEQIKKSSAPDQIKNQVSAAYSTKDMLDVVRGIIAKKPQLLGPAAGRLEQAYQGIGSSFGMQNPEDEKDAATLAGHLAYLFANELRASFPGRPNREVIEELKKASAQLQQSPNIVEGMLRSAENNANIAIQGGKRWGIDISGNGGAASGSAPSNDGAKRVRIKF